MDQEKIKNGRVFFNPTKGKIDFSGEDFSKIYFGSSSSLDHAYLNGIQVEDCGFHQLNMVQVEMAQSEISNSQFLIVDMRGTDLVETTFKDVHFINCAFVEGEWRETLFVRCHFRECDFDHTTINLCIFQDCEFDSKSLEHFSQMGKNYNTFIGTSFSSFVDNDVVISRNFSLPSKGNVKALSILGDEATLEAVCLASASDNFEVEPIVVAIERELSSAARLRTMRIKFISNIIEQMSTARMISPSTLIYIADLLHAFARSTPSDVDLRTAMSAAISMRSAIYEASHYDDTGIEMGGCLCRHLKVTYEADLDIEDAAVLVELLNSAVPSSSANFVIEDVRPGSLLVEIAVSGAITLSATLGALNLALRQATITVKSATALKSAWREFRDTPACSSPALCPSDNQKYYEEKLSAIERNSGLEDSMRPVHMTVKKVGRRVARIDRQANVTVELDRSNRMKEIRD